MADDCCPEGARLRATQSAAWSIMIAASADAAAHEAADKAVRVAVEAYWAHRATHRSANPPPSAPQGDGGGVVPPKERVGALAEGASPMTPEPCWLCSGWGMVCSHVDDVMGHPRVHVYSATDIGLCRAEARPCPACRVRELEAQLSATSAALTEMDTQGELGPEGVRSLLLLYALTPDEELTGDGRALKAALLTVVREAGFVPASERAALQTLRAAAARYHGEATNAGAVAFPPYLTTAIEQADVALKEAK